MVGTTVEQGTREQLLEAQAPGTTIVARGAAVIIWFPNATMVQTVTHEAQTSGQGDVRDITEVVSAAVADSRLSAGIVTVAVVGSTAGITTIEHEPGAVADFGAMFERLAPRAGAYRHHERWGDDNGSSHVRAALLGPSLTLPFTGGRVRLGTWQQIVLAELDTRPRQRQVVVQILGE